MQPDTLFYELKRLDKQIVLLRSKIDTESRFLHAAISMSVGYNDGTGAKFKAQAESAAIECQRRIDFLTGELRRAEAIRVQMAHGEEVREDSLPTYQETSSPIGTLCLYSPF